MHDSDHQRWMGLMATTTGLSFLVQLGVQIALIVLVATQFGALLGGAAVLEKLFERRGLGTLLVEAYGARDLPVLEACVVLSGVLFAVVSACGNALQALIDPRVRE